MNTPRLMLSFATLLMAAIAQGEQPDDIARGNMHFDAKAMDGNGDGMISKDEMQKYGEDMWTKLARNEKRTLSVTDAAQDFARGGLRVDAKAMDADHDGQISKDEFMKYNEVKFDKMKKSNGMISVADAARDFGRGGMHLDQKPTEKKDGAY
jgi:Ca2+-binding EF-hand superfamily protein